jgi:hypothetical protein
MKFKERVNVRLQLKQVGLTIARFGANMCHLVALPAKVTTLRVGMPSTTKLSLRLLVRGSWKREQR